MPSFSIGVQCESGRINARFFEKTRKIIYDDADNVVDICNQQNNEFAKNLGKYLKNRRNSVHLFSDDDAQVASRSSYIRKLVTYISSNDIAKQMEMLKEENIRCFKGFFTQRLYDQLVSRRKDLQQETVATQSNCSSQYR